MVSALAFYSDDQSLNHAEVDSLKSVKCLNTTNINKKDAGDGHLNIRSFIKIFKFFLPETTSFVQLGWVLPKLDSNNRSHFPT